MIINTKDKTVESQGENLGEVVGELQKLFPENWGDYKIATKVEIIQNWYPWYQWQILPQPTVDPNPWWQQPYTTCGSITNDITDFTITY